MLEDAVFESARGKHRNPLMIAYSVLLHTTGIGILILVPLLQMHAVPIPELDSLLPPPQFVHQDVIELKPPPPAPKGLTIDPEAIVAPITIPSEIAHIVEEPSAAAIGVARSDRGTDIRSIFNEVVKKPEEIVTPPLPPVEPETAAVPNDQPVRVSSGPQQARLIRRVVPSYPPLAQQNHIQGLVVLEAIISKEGRIDSLRVVSGHPLLFS